jgi:hypothetical protein
MAQIIFRQSFAEPSTILQFFGFLAETRSDFEAEKYEKLRRFENKVLKIIIRPKKKKRE